MKQNKKLEGKLNAKEREFLRLISKKIKGYKNWFDSSLIETRRKSKLIAPIEPTEYLISLFKQIIKQFRSKLGCFKSDEEANKSMEEFLKGLLEIFMITKEVGRVIGYDILWKNIEKKFKNQEWIKKEDLKNIIGDSKYKKLYEEIDKLLRKNPGMKKEAAIMEVFQIHNPGFNLKDEKWRKKYASFRRAYYKNRKKYKDIEK